MFAPSTPRRGETKSHKTAAIQQDKPVKRKLQTEDKVVQKVLKFTLEAASDRFWPGVNQKKIFMPWKKEELIADLMPRHIVHSNSELAGVDKEQVIGNSIEVLVERGDLTVAGPDLYRLNDDLLTQVS